MDRTRISELEAERERLLVEIALLKRKADKAKKNRAKDGEQSADGATDESSVEQGQGCDF